MINQVEEEIRNSKSNSLFLMIKDTYCINGLKLSQPLACFFAFLVFTSDRFSHNNKGIQPFIGYSNKELTRIYSSKWFKISERSLVQYLQELKKLDLISIENNGNKHRRIYINYLKIKPELLGIVDTDITKEYKIQIENLTKEINELKQQNELLLSQMITQETNVEIITEGLFAKILYDKKYLTEKDGLTRSQLNDYNVMLKDFLYRYGRENKDFFATLSYICTKSKKKKINNKFAYLYTSLENYLNRNDSIELWPDD